MKTYEHHPFSLLYRVAELYHGVDMHDVLLLACQHMLAPQLKMFELLIKSGLNPENCLIAGKSYSTNESMMHKLCGLGCAVADFSDEFHPLVSFDDWFDSKIDTFLFEELAGRNLASFRKIIVLDDGGFMHKAAVRFFGNDPRLAGIEQTSSGHNRIKEAGILFSTHYIVARSTYKQYEEAPYIGHCGTTRILEHIQKRGKNAPNILILGLGTIGRQMAGRLLIVQGLRGMAADIGYHNSKKSLRGFGANQLLEFNGRHIEYAEAMRRLAEFDVIVGASGSPVLADSDIGRLHPEISLISMSSSDREFPALHFRNGCTRVHDDCYVGDRCLANSGFPITFMGLEHEVRPIEIELTIAQLQICVMASAGEGSDILMPIMSNAMAQVHHIWQSESQPTLV